MSSHRSYIDALRGFAAAAVLFTHMPVLFDGLAWRVDYVARLGAHGVQLFFMVSAITLALSWEARSESELSPARAFYIRRFFRIAPMFWLAGLLYVGIDNFMVPWWHNGVVDGRSIFLTALFAHGWSPGTINAVVPGGWSIADEMTFYLVFPLLMVVLTSLRRAVLFFGLTVLLALAANLVPAMIFDTRSVEVLRFIYFWLPNQLPVFAMGFVTYRLLPMMRSASKVYGIALFCFAAAVGLFMVTVPLEFSATLSHPVIWRDLVAALGFMTLILGLSAMPISILVNRATVFLGKVSFSSYLVQFAVIQAALMVIGKIEAPGVLGMVLLPCLFVPLLGINTAIAAVTYHVIERPFLKLGLRIADRAAFAGAPAIGRVPA